MRNRQLLLCFFIYLVFATAATLVVQAQEATREPSEIPRGNPSQISDWALAGVIWSDASLTRRLAIEAARSTESSEQREEYQRVADKSSGIVAALETFGWRHVREDATAAASRPGATEAPAENAPLPQPEEVGAELAESMGLSQSAGRPTRGGDQPLRSTPAPAARRPATIGPVDADSPRGIDDDIDAALNTDRRRMDIDHYRVDDMVEETPIEASSRVEAIEDGVEDAIAAAPPRGIAGPTTGRLSRREVMTRSSTLPYARGTIYDGDAYDPDAKFKPFDASVPVDEEPRIRPDGDGDVQIIGPIDPIEGEGELTEALSRQNPAFPDARPPTRSMERVATPIDRYTTDQSIQSQDAKWVQFHLDSNQAIWNRLTTNDNLRSRLTESVTKLRADAITAFQATDDPQLTQILRSIIE